MLLQVCAKAALNRGTRPPRPCKGFEICETSKGKGREMDGVGGRMHYSQLSLVIYRMNKPYHPICHAPQENMCLYVQSPKPVQQCTVNLPGFYQGRMNMRALSPAVFTASPSVSPQLEPQRTSCPARL
jgi:hypothetical protein